MPKHVGYGNRRQLKVPKLTARQKAAAKAKQRKFYDERLGIQNEIPFSGGTRY